MKTKFGEISIVHCSSLQITQAYENRAGKVVCFANMKVKILSN